MLIFLKSLLLYNLIKQGAVQFLLILIQQPLKLFYLNQFINYYQQFVMKTQFELKLESVSNKVDRTMSIQKSSYKGLVAFFKEYMDIENTYSSSLLQLSQKGGDYIGLKFSIPECLKLKQQTQIIKTMMAQLLYNCKTLSQIHFNFCNRLKQTHDNFAHEYQLIKTKKQKFMFILKQNYPLQLQKNKINRQDEEKKIARGLFTIVQELEEIQSTRIQKIRQNMIIFYTQYRKNCQKEEQITKSSATKLSKTQIQSTSEQLIKLANDLANIHNRYPGQDKIVLKEINLKYSINLRSQLRYSTNQSSRIRVQKNKKALASIEKENDGNDLLQKIEDTKYDKRIGLLTKQMKDYRQYSKFINVKLMNKIIISMFESFYFEQIKDPDLKYVFLNIKGKMGVTQNKPKLKTKNFSEYIENQLIQLSVEEKTYFNILIKFNNFYENWDEAQFQTQIYQEPQTDVKIDNKNFEFNTWMLAVFIDSLLETMFNFKNKNEQFLVENYPEIFKFIVDFASDFLNVEAELILLILIEKCIRLQFYRSEHRIQPNIQEFDETLLKCVMKRKENFHEITPLTYHYKSKIKNLITLKLQQLFDPLIKPKFYIQILFWIQTCFSDNAPSPQHILKCIQFSGYKYILQKDEDRELFSSNWQNKERMMNVANVIKNNNFLRIDKEVLVDIAQQISKYYNKGYEQCLHSVRSRFLSNITKIIITNLETIESSEYDDKEGYLLVLGIEICKIDQLSNQTLQYYKHYFKLLDISFNGMERQYKDLLEQTKLTETWLILENQNLFATQNCYDFCSLLAKPIQFMMNTLNELISVDHSEFKNKFIGLIKIKLNNIIKTEVVSYVKFIHKSLQKINTNEPKVIFEPIKYQKIVELDLNRNWNNISQMFRRLNNILFLKHQANQIIKDMIQNGQTRIPDFFKTDIIKKEIQSSNNQDEKQLLKILLNIAEDILSYEERIKNIVAKGILYHYFRDFFINLYFRFEKGAFEEFFSNSKVELSEHTFMKYKQIIENLMEMIRRNVPPDYYLEILSIFLNTLYLSTKVQILNRNKFRIPLEKQMIYDYINKDVGNLVSLLKQTYKDDDKVIQLIDKKLHSPLRIIIEMIKQDSNKIIAKFETASINKNMEQSNQLLALLNLRITQPKTKQFVKKYKKPIK